MKLLRLFAAGCAVVSSLSAQLIKVEYEGPIQTWVSATRPAVGDLGDFVFTFYYNAGWTPEPGSTSARAVYIPPPDAIRWWDLRFTSQFGFNAAFGAITRLTVINGPLDEFIVEYLSPDGGSFLKARLAGAAFERNSTFLPRNSFPQGEVLASEFEFKNTGAFNFQAIHLTGTVTGSVWDPTLQPVPEPSTSGFAACTLLGVAVLWRRKARPLTAAAAAGA